MDMNARELHFRLGDIDLVYGHDPERQRREWEAVAIDAVAYAESLEEDLCRLADLVRERRA
jgi:hypothetical protein